MHALYRTTRDPSFQPNTAAYTSCLNAYAYPSTLEERPVALNLLRQTMEELEPNTYCAPNYISYATFLRGICNLMPDGAECDALSLSTFENWCKRGQVHYSVLTKSRRASKNVFTQKLGPLAKKPFRVLMLHELSWSTHVANIISKGRTSPIPSEAKTS